MTHQSNLLFTYIKVTKYQNYINGSKSSDICAENSEFTCNLLAIVK